MPYFVASIFLSAFLIFQIQPLIAKYILPWFGGSPAVWSTVQMFFQVLLTGGYAYANWLNQPGRGREKWHAAFLALSVALLALLAWNWRSPITPDASWKPDPDASPVIEILKLLSLSVGLPYLLLASNSPLMQAWFHRRFPQNSAYWLYAVSNVGSLLGLITYPLIIEPLLALPQQGWLWSLSYLCFAGLAMWGAIRIWRQPVSSSHHPEPSAPRLAAPPLRLNHVALWIGLAATASLLFLAVTSRITQEVAAVPFLWVLPLTIYLLTFIIAFSGERWYSRQVFMFLLFGGTIFVLWAIALSDNINIIWQIVIYTLFLFIACMICHGELYRLRPPPARLTQFYLLVSFGGAIGGIFTTFIAPLLFRAYWELPISITLVWMFVLFLVLDQPRPESRWRFVLSRGMPASALSAALILTVISIQSDLTTALRIERNFYGVVRVKELPAGDDVGKRYALVHGITNHGFQFADPEQRNLPTAYFTETSGIGLAMLHHPRRGHGMRIGVLGLGIGTLAAYGQPGDIYRFYEINPAVISIAQDRNGVFSYLADSKAEIEIVPGDARLSLERELTAEAFHRQHLYDVLVLDVFSSDSVPVHLINREAFAIYLEHVAPGGILAVHISNRHFDLTRVVLPLADYYNLARVVIADEGDMKRSLPSLWVLLAREPETLAAPEIVARARPEAMQPPSLPLWTDDYSNLIQILK